MKIIDLLNRIAKDEGIPIKIKFKGKEYEWSQEFYDYRCIDENHRYLVEDLETEDLNRTCEEIPLIEEDKKIEHVETFRNGWNEIERYVNLENKINEIIDYINRGE